MKILSKEPIYYSVGFGSLVILVIAVTITYCLIKRKRVHAAKAEHIRRRKYSPSIVVPQTGKNKPFQNDKRVKHKNKVKFGPNVLYSFLNNPR